MIDDAINIIVSYYNIDKNILLDFLEKNKNPTNFDNIILPYTGKIFEDKCKGIVFNHGLYTQCCEKVKTKFCKVCEKEKYGYWPEKKPRTCTKTLEIQKHVFILFKFAPFSVYFSSAPPNN